MGGQGLSRTVSTCLVPLEWCSRPAGWHAHREDLVLCQCDGLVVKEPAKLHIRSLESVWRSKQLLQGPANLTVVISCDPMSWASMASLSTLSGTLRPFGSRDHEVALTPVPLTPPLVSWSWGSAMYPTSYRNSTASAVHSVTFRFPYSSEILSFAQPPARLTTHTAVRSATPWIDGGRMCNART